MLWKGDLHEKYEEAEKHLDKMGVKISKMSLDLDGMMGHKDDVVKSNTQGIEFLFKKNKIKWLKGAGKIEGKGKVSVDGTEYSAKHIIIATGSDVSSLPGVDIDEKNIVSSEGALKLPKVPKVNRTFFQYMDAFW